MTSKVESRSCMGLDVTNALFGNFHLSWAGTRWFGQWCDEREVPDPFIGWETGGNNGDPCLLGPCQKHTDLAVEWCAALKRKEPTIAAMGQKLLLKPPEDFRRYLYSTITDQSDGPSEELQQRIVAAWYAILRYGIEQGDTLFYW